MPPHSRLQGIRDVKRVAATELVAANILSFFNWGCVQAGGFTDVALGDPLGEDVLIPAGKPGLVDGRVWRTQHPSWCFEAGLDGGVDPVKPVGATVDGTLHDPVAGPLTHHLDYRRGLVVFDQAIPTTSTVQLSYSKRDILFANPGPAWFQRVVLDGYAVDPAAPNGSLAVMADERIQTPVVVIETTGVPKARGHQLGGAARRTTIALLLHVLATNADDRDRIADVIVSQQNKTIAMHDVAARRAAGDFELDARGSLRSPASQYPDLAIRYPHTSLYVATAHSIVQPANAQLHVATCRLDVELIADVV